MFYSSDGSLNQHTNSVSARTTSRWITALLTDMPKLDTARRLTVKHLKMTKDREICSQYPDLKTDNTSAHLSTIRRELVKSVIRIKDLPLYMHYKSFSLNITYFFLTGNRPRCTLYLTLEESRFHVLNMRLQLLISGAWEEGLQCII